MYVPQSLFKPRCSDRFLIIHAAVVPACIVVAALVSRAAGLDDWLEAAFFDPISAGFPARQWAMLETLGHRVAKSAVWGVWLLILSLAAASSFAPRLRAYTGLLWTTVFAMAIGPAIVVVLKSLNSYRCPWDLVQFGGVARASSDWFVSRINAGRCFPSGHAAGGFSLIALCFAGMALGHPGLRRAGLVAALAAGSVFSVVRMAQGAHFLSHNLWSAAIDWCAAALVFAPSLMLRPRRGVSSSKATDIARVEREGPR